MHATNDWLSVTRTARVDEHCSDESLVIRNLVNEQNVLNDLVSCRRQKSKVRNWHNGLHIREQLNKWHTLHGPTRGTFLIHTLAILIVAFEYMTHDS